MAKEKAKANTEEEKFDEGYERPPSVWVKWGKIGDVIKGTFVDKSERSNKDGSKQWVYEIKAEAGSFFYFEKQEDGSIKMDEVATKVEKGELYKVGGKKIIDNVMRRAKLGQKVLFRFSDTFKMPQGVAKTIETKLGGMDETFEEERDNTDGIAEIDFE